MSHIIICDRCGKVINEANRATPNKNGEYEIPAESRMSLCDGHRQCDLCLDCKTKLYNWLFNGAPLDLDDELNEKKARLRASSQIIAVAKEETK